MNLPTLLLQLKPLMDQPLANFEKIADLLGRHQALAEYEVARFYVARVFSDGVLPLAASLDPRERLRAVELVRLTFSRSHASRILRHLVKDPDSRVRHRARSTRLLLGLDDVALNDPRYENRLGRFATEGWSFGLFRHHRHYYRKPDRVNRGATARQLGVPPLDDPADVARLLEVDDADELVRFCRPGVGLGSGYVEFAVAKAKGGERLICAPRAELRALQRKILREVLDKLPLHDACHGFRRGRSTLTNAQPHVAAPLVVKTDLKDFFPTIHYRRVVGLFAHYGIGLPAATLLARLTTHRPRLVDGTVVWPGRLPQGAPTSPALANLVCRRLDHRLARLGERCGAVYTRYADDLTFSFAREDVDLGRFLWWIDQICQQEGFAENTSKRRILRRQGQQRVTGIVVNEAPHLPRRERQKFRAILHNCRRHGIAAEARGRSDFVAYLHGFAAYAQMVQPELGAAWAAEVDALVAAEAGPDVG
jgi:hypothetical protein